MKPEGSTLTSTIPGTVDSPPGSACIAKPDTTDIIEESEASGKPSLHELCAGSAILTKTAKEFGFDGTAVDHKWNRHNRYALVLSLDLGKKADCSTVIKSIAKKAKRAKAAHWWAAPCGTAPKARDMPVGPNAPQRLRSQEHPQGGCQALLASTKTR